MALIPELSGTMGASWAMEAFLCPLFLSFSEFTFLVIFIRVLLLYSAILVSAVKQSESVSCIYIYIYIYLYHAYVINMHETA